VGGYWEGCASECRIRWEFNAYTEAAIIVRGNDISEEPMTQRWKGGKR
jgi:hypothetical protein